MRKAVLLFSDGLDSMLAGLILRKQGISIIALRLITPFFGWKYKNSPEKFYQKVKELGFEKGILIDITTEFLEVLKSPKYGYGSYANPCIDCKILMLKKAYQVMKEEQADFIATGEVLGQRPMSQNKNSLELIEKRAGVEGKVLRPLSALYLKPTEAEEKGLVDRNKLFAIRGRKRTEQLKLAKDFGIKDIPSPSGGCLLTDPQIGSRVLKVLKEKRPLNPKTCEFLTFGRHIMEEGLWIVLGRNQEENKRLETLAGSEFLKFRLDVPSPTAVVLQGNPPIEFVEELLIKYSKKAREAIKQGRQVKCISW